MKGPNLCNRLSCVPAICFGVALAFQAGSVYGTNTMISDQNSSVLINPTSQTGVNNWTVDGNNYLDQQWFWYRVDGGGQSSIDTLTLTGSTLTANELDTTYAGNGLAMDVSYVLAGSTPGSGQATLTENISIQNTTSNSIPLSFYQYSHFLLGASSVVSLGKDLHGLFDEAFQTGPGVSLTEMLDTGITPGANEGEATNYPVTLTGLNSGSKYVLGGSTSAGPGNVTWAFEWDKTLTASGTGAGSQLQISKVESIQVPEPCAFGLLSVGMAALALRRSKIA